MRIPVRCPPAGWSWSRISPGTRLNPVLVYPVAVVRRFLQFAFGTLLALPGAASVQKADGEFTRVPFAKWLDEGRVSQLRWGLEIPSADLSSHQRLILRISVRVDGRELESRRDQGDFLVLVQITDSAGVVRQDHTAIDLNKLRAGIAAQDIYVTEHAFVLPGEYQVAVAICDPRSLKHSLAIRKVLVAPLKSEPLPASWVGLPTVEFIPGITEPPDVWYLPAIERAPNLELKTSKRVHIQLLVNTTPSERNSGLLTAMRRNMALAVPALKVVSNIRLSNGTMDAALLDLTHHKVAVEQIDVRKLDWPRFAAFFKAMRPGLVDVATLAGEWKMRQFLRDEVERRLNRKTDGTNVVIVISGPAFFDNQEPVPSEPLPPNPDRRLFYIRTRNLVFRPAGGRGGPSGFGRGYPGRARQGMRPPAMNEAPRMPMPADDLERSVEPLGARIFDASTPEEFRRILSVILDQIGRS